MPIPLVDLQIQYRRLAAEIQAALGRVCSSCAFILGPEVESFEREFAEYCGVEHIVGVGSGTDAIHLACRALDIGPGDEVITSAHTFIATLTGIELAGARPVLVDCREADFLIAPESIESAITEKTKAIVPVHLYGQCADMDPILSIAQRHGIAVIEDAAQAHGAMYRGRKAGTMGDIGCFSFYPAKNLGSYGDGGACSTNKKELRDRLLHLRNMGSIKKYHHDFFGVNSRLDSLQAAVLRAKLPYLNEWNEARNRHAQSYTRLLQGHPVVLPSVSENRFHVFHIYAVRVAHRDNILKYLHDKGIGVGVHYPIPPHLSPASSLGYKKGDFPVTEKLCSEVLSLPMYAELTPEQIETVVGTLIEALRL